MRNIIIALILLFIPIAGFAEQPLAYGPTTDADELWQIAISVRPDASVSIEQTMLAILKANPSAFSDNNAYKLKPGYVLIIPVKNEITAIPAKMAQQKIEEQHKIFLGLNKASHEDKKETKSLQNEEQVNKIKQAITNATEEYQTRLEMMEKQNQELQAKIDDLNSTVTHLKQEVLTVHRENAQQHQPSTLTLFLYSYKKYLPNFFDATELKLLAGLGLLLIVWWSYLNYKRKKLDVTFLRPNYDFMGGEEGADAKLDLARAYIDMDDKESARKVLSELLIQGNDKQKTEAQQLLKKIA